MKTRNLAMVVAAFLAMLGSVDPGAAQERMGRRASLFDLGIYGGGAYTTDWFESRTVTSTGGVITERDDREGHRIGLAPIFGANATFYGLPWFGVRVHYGYMPSDLPEANDDGAGNTGDSGSIVNNHFYDLSLLFRLPGLPVFSSLVGDLYGWIGGGGLTTNVAGKGGPNTLCVQALVTEGACLSHDPEHATVGQGVVGLGGDLVSLSSNVGLFAELAAHIYDSPVHVGDAWVPRIRVSAGQPFKVADDRYAVTPRLVAGLKFAFGEIGGAPAVVPVAPPPPPPPPPPPAPTTTAIRVCVVQGTTLTEVEAQFNPTTGDTMVMQGGMSQRFSTAFPASAPSYAAGETWFVNNDSITFENRQYVKFGVTRVISPAQVTHVGTVNGVPAFAETGATAPHQVLYVPVRPGCEFQPYQLRQAIRARG